jgi:hypothetical protein
MNAFYVDLLRGERVALLAGPFRSELIARKYERAAFQAACDADARACFDRYGVVGVDPAKHFKVGKVNHLIEIDPADLAQSIADLEPEDERRTYCRYPFDERDTLAKGFAKADVHALHQAGRKALWRREDQQFIVEEILQ